MKYVTLADHAMREYAPDKIFAASQKAKAAIAELGGDAVINSTLGECQDDDGRLMVLPTVEKMLRSMPIEEMCSYAPIGGIPGFNEAVQISLFGHVSERFHVESVPTPGGCGALRHAIWNFLDNGDSLLTTDWIWGPYRNICEEHGRFLKDFPMFNDQDELVAITASKITDADNMGFGIPVTALRELLEQIGDLDTSVYNVQCNSCDEFISDEEEYCPSCGDKLPSNVFQERSLTDLAVFCEEAIQAMGINPVLARVGYESWVFHKGSSEIRMFVYQRSYLFCTSPINVLPKKNLEPVLTYLLNAEVRPYQLGLDGNQIYLSYRIHISDIFSDFADEVQKNITNMAFKADELDNYLMDTFGCELSEYAKKDA